MTAEQKTDLLEELRAVLPNDPRAQAVFERVREELDPDRLLTTREAADLLGIRSVNTFKTLLRVENVPVVKVGTHTRVPRREVERLRGNRRVLRIQASDRMWDRMDEAFGTEGLTQAQMDALWESQPGTAPWERSK